MHASAHYPSASIAMTAVVAGGWRRLTLGACTGFAVLACGSAQAAACEPAYTFRTNPVFGLAEIMRLATPVRDEPPVQTADGIRLIVRPFSEEDHPTYGRWRAAAVVFISRGDLGEEPVGGLLLQNLLEDPLRADAFVVIKSRDGLRLEVPNRAGCGAYVIRVAADGGLTAGGRLVGRLR